MATKKKRADKIKVDTVSAKLPGGVTIECRSPGIAEWDRYIAKRRQQQDAVGRREMVATCCVSHSGDDAMGLLRRFPAAVKPIHAKLEKLAGGDCLTDIGEDRVTVFCPDGSELEFRLPECDEWEEIEGNKSEPLDWHSDTRDKCKRLLTEGDSSALERWPAMLTSPVLDSLATLAGMGVEVKVKKA